MPAFFDGFPVVERARNTYYVGFPVHRNVGFPADAPTEMETKTRAYKSFYGWAACETGCSHARKMLRYQYLHTTKD